MSFVTSTTYAPFTITSFPHVPLPTAFTRPTDCEGFHIRQTPGFRDILIAERQSGPDSSFASSCYPSGFSTDEKSFFSPGVECPNGYWKACAGTGLSSNPITTMTCCPIHSGRTSLSCVTNLPRLTNQWKSQFCTWVVPQGGEDLTVTRLSGGLTFTEITTLKGPPEGLNAFGIRMVYQSTDLPTITSAISQTTSTSPTRQQPTSGPGGQSSDDGGGGLGTRATIVAAVVIPVVVIAAVLGFFFWRRARRIWASEQQSSEQSFAKPDPTFNPHYYHAERPSELPIASPSAELPAAQKPFELPIHTYRYELS
ncbi:hypothetical protein QBC43DRAFT_349361 [Cladorrhinum sp. PSN259]|nr:hypothetical protein QBC43DRAFT_349361 [Cladorrhinum sp. PSN259]